LHKERLKFGAKKDRWENEWLKLEKVAQHFDMKRARTDGGEERIREQ